MGWIHLYLFTENKCRSLLCFSHKREMGSINIYVGRKLSHFILIMLKENRFGGIRACRFWILLNLGRSCVIQMATASFCFELLLCQPEKLDTAWPHSLWYVASTTNLQHSASHPGVGGGMVILLVAESLGCPVASVRLSRILAWFCRVVKKQRGLSPSNWKLKS